MLFASFDIYDNVNRVNADLMKDIVTFARKSLNITKPVYLYGPRFSRVTQKQSGCIETCIQLISQFFQAMWKIY